MNEVDSQKAVFFCGAGISMSSGLPGFGGLVRTIYAQNHITPDDVEAVALDRYPEDHPDRGDFFGDYAKFDKALGLLERQSRLGSARLRKTVVELLSKRARTLDVHRALIQLSKTSKGIRLVTTNFDDRFKSAGLPERQIDVCPKLPVPKAEEWHSLVHLHGRILKKDDDGQNFVLTSADFGRAYLTERWAARFVTELFREFTVVFVGYSLEDPVMTYMVDALSADSAKLDRLGRFRKAYAFAPYNGGPSDRRRTENSWRAVKNVEPILYDDQDNHKQLNDTLIVWAKLRRDPLNARKEIAVSEVSKMPNGRNDPVAERVVWALQDVGAAEALARSDPITDETDYEKVVAWLDVFDQAKLLSQPNGDPTRSDTTSNSLVGHDFHMTAASRPSRVTLSLAYWISQHIHIPQVLTWVLNKGGHLHPVLKEQVRLQLGRDDREIHEKLRGYWTVLVDQEYFDPSDTLGLRNRLQAQSSAVEKYLIEEKAIEALRPILLLKPGPSSLHQMMKVIDANSPPLSPIDECAHFEFSLAIGDHIHSIETILADKDVLAQYTDRFQQFLQRAVLLLSNAEGIRSESHRYQRSIAEHEQDRFKDAWTKLIDLVRDCYFVLADRDRNAAANMLERWTHSDELLFRRLALHVLTDDPKANIHHAKRLLLKGRKPGLWEFELHRETLRFLRLAGKMLPRKLRAEVVDAILAGPKHYPTKDAEYIERQIALRLRKLSMAGVPLRRAAEAYLTNANLPGEDSEERDEFLSWSGGAEWVSPQSESAIRLRNGSVQLWVDSLRAQEIEPDAFREQLALRRPVRAAAALRHLADEGSWQGPYWQGIFRAINQLRHQQKASARLPNFLATVVLNAPDPWFVEVAPQLTDFLEDLAEEWPTDEEEHFYVLWQKAWSALPDEQAAERDDPVNHALNHPLGRLAEAALHRLWKYELKARMGLPEAVQSYFQTIAAHAKGHLGRVRLMMQLQNLFAIDPQWTKDHLISKLGPASSKTAHDLWFAYVWSPRIGPDLFVAIKAQFLDVLRTPDTLGRMESHLVELFVEVCLAFPDDIAESEIESVVSVLSEADLSSILRQMAKHFSGEPRERAEVWKRQIRPWLNRYWPNEGDRQTAETSKALIHLLFEAGDAFPDAVSWASIYLRPIPDHLFRIVGSDFLRGYFDDCLNLLTAIISELVLQAWERSTLGRILDQIEEGNPQVSTDPRFIDLRRISRL